MSDPGQLPLFDNLPPSVTKGIGGSEIAALFGLSSFLTPLELWERKTGRGSEGAPNRAQLRGVRLEPMVKRVFEKRAGVRLSAGQRGKHPHWSRGVRMYAATDGTLPSGGIFEAKTTALGGDKHRTFARGRVPIGYAMQLQHYASVLGRSGGVICCLAGPARRQRWRPGDCELYAIGWRRVEEAIALMEEAVGAFYRDHIFSDTPPGFELHPGAARLEQLLGEQEGWLGPFASSPGAAPV